MWLFLSVLCCLYSVDTTLSFHHAQYHLTSSSLNTHTSDRNSSPTALHAIEWPFSPKTTSALDKENGLDPHYPWRFEGRFIFRPSLVRVRTEEHNLPPCSNLVSFLGYTLGGSVVLEYDISPVGPYKEYVNMGGVVALGRVCVGESFDGLQKMKQLGLGQWGTNLFVSTQVAEDVCREIWGVPATLADIEFERDGECLRDGPEEITGRNIKFNLSGWDNARITTNTSSTKRFGGVPIIWTPTIKALWAPFSFPFNGCRDSNTFLPVHKLRLSASALSLKRCERVKEPSSDEIPLGLALVVDNVLIEIGRRVTSGSI